jgi:hypothetical protein
MHVIIGFTPNYVRETLDFPRFARIARPAKARGMSAPRVMQSHQPFFNSLSAIGNTEVFDLEESLDAAFRARPTPLSFTLLNEAISVEMMPSLMPTMPYSSASATRRMRPMSRLC